MASRIDAFADELTDKYGISMREQVEERLKFFDSGETPRRNVDVMQEVAAQLRAERGDGLVVEARELVEADGRVELEVGADLGQLLLLEHLVVEEADLLLVRVVAAVHGRAVVGDGRHDELGRRVGEHVVEGRGVAALHERHLVAVLVLDRGRDAVVDGEARRERERDGKEREHAVVHLLHLVRGGEALEAAVLREARDLGSVAEGGAGDALAAEHRLRVRKREQEEELRRRGLETQAAKGAVRDAMRQLEAISLEIQQERAAPT